MLVGRGEDVLPPLHLPGISLTSPLHLAQVKTCFSNEGQPPDPACPAGFSRTYIGTNCATNPNPNPNPYPNPNPTVTLTLTLTLTLTQTLTRHQLRGHGSVAGGARQQGER